MPDPILEISDLRVAFDTERGRLIAVDGVSFHVPKGKTVGIVGESGCGKSVTAMSIVQLLPRPMGKVTGGTIRFKGRDTTRCSSAEMRKIRGGEIGVIFQEPMTALNPVHRIGKQIGESLMLHKGLDPRQALAEAVQLLENVGIPDPGRRVMDYPHQLSGGMRQRVMIAIAIACAPDLLIADEPTTALDVTVQAQILELLGDLQRANGMSVILITHDLGLIAQNCDEVVVMYAGRVVEQAPVTRLFADPTHAYTRGLLDSIPSLDLARKSRLNTIEGQVAGLADFVPGCRFCQRRGIDPSLLTDKPPLVRIGPDHWVADCPRCNPKHLSETSAGGGPA